MIVSRALYETAQLIKQQPTAYESDNANHRCALDEGIASLNGLLIELTEKGLLVAALE